MALIQSYRPGGSGGGGGVTITGWSIEQFTQTTNFAAGTVIITLPTLPISLNAIAANYNGQTIYPGVDFTLLGSQITIVFGDSYVTDYDAPPVFRFQYPY